MSTTVVQRVKPIMLNVNGNFLKNYLNQYLFLIDNKSIYVQLLLCIFVIIKLQRVTCLKILTTQK